MHDPGEVARKHNTKISAFLPHWYRDSIKLVVWLNWLMLILMKVRMNVSVRLKSNLEEELQLAKRSRSFCTNFGSSA